MKKQINGFVHLRTGQWCDKDDYVLLACKIEDNKSYQYVAEGVLHFDIPAGFDPRAAMVEALKAEKIKLMADFHARCTEIESKISELTCLEMS